MKTNLKRRLAILPLLACSTLALASEPVLLRSADMDRITAGTQPIFEHIASMLATVTQSAANLTPGGLFPLAADQLARLQKLVSGELVSFHQSSTGELVATQQLQSGEQLVLVRQLTPADAASTRALSPGGNVTTYLLQPGETLNIQQTSSGGANYLYIRSSGASSITTTQQTIR